MFFYSSKVNPLVELKNNNSHDSNQEKLFYQNNRRGLPSDTDRSGLEWLGSTNHVRQLTFSFGLITVTHTRQGDNSQFMKYLDKYATMDCPIVTELNIVWNNEQSMEELGIFVNQAQWKRPVYFYRTPSNSMNWRYKIPKESKSQVFFSIDDDITVDCEELNKGFEVWRSNAIGNIAPIISYGPRYYEYTLRGGFQYGKGKTQHFFNMGLVGLAFISRHFMDLYYTDLFEVK